VQLSNNSIAILALVTLVLLGMAGLLVMGGLVERPDVDAVAQPIEVTDLFVIPEIRERTGEAKEGEMVGPLRIETTSRTRAPSASVQCGIYYKTVKQLVHHKAEFTQLPHANCQLQLDGAFYPYPRPVGPGQHLRCWIKSGETQCAGSGDSVKQARITVDADVVGTVTINGTDYGELPVGDIEVPARQPLEVILDIPATHHRVQWHLVMAHGEFQNLFFPVARTNPSAAKAARVDG
jgi:hypothetical protein